MERIWLPTVAFVFLLVIESASSDFEGSIGELHFTIPDVTGNFNEAVSWCTTNNNSTLAVVNDSDIQMALSSVLSSSSLRSMMYINVKLYPKPNDTWFLLDGSNYNGDIGNQDPSGRNYSFHCRLRFVGNGFIVEASAPSDFRKYICDYEDERCNSDSDNNIVYNGRCYVKYENETLTWYQARERCMSYGGDLAQFQPGSNTYIPPFNTAWLSNSITYWVGIRWNDWSWKPSEIDQEYIFTSWSNGKPNNHNNGCVSVDPNGSHPWSWTDSDCTTQRQFVCLKKVPIQTTTPVTTIITTTMNPTTTAGPETTTWNSVPESTVPTNRPNDNTSIAADKNMNLPLIIGLAVGIGGGGLILLIVVIVVVIVICKRRQRRNKGGSDSEYEGYSNGEVSDQIHNGVYAAVVPGKNQGKQTESPKETIYTSPVFINEPNSPPPDHSYETVDLGEEPDVVRSFNRDRGQTKSIYPQGHTDVYANAKEVPNAND